MSVLVVSDAHVCAPFFFLVLSFVCLVWLITGCCVLWARVVVFVVGGGGWCVGVGVCFLFVGCVCVLLAEVGGWFLFVGCGGWCVFRWVIGLLFLVVCVCVL